jgi:hypothetical protein
MLQAIVRHSVTATVLLCFISWYYWRTERAYAIAKERDVRNSGISAVENEGPPSPYVLARAVLRSHINHSRFDFIEARPDPLTRGISGVPPVGTLLLYRHSLPCGEATSKNSPPRIVAELMEFASFSRLFPTVITDLIYMPPLSDGRRNYRRGASGRPYAGDESELNMRAVQGNKRTRRGFFGALSNFISSSSIDREALPLHAQKAPRERAKGDMQNMHASTGSFPSPVASGSASEDFAGDPVEITDVSGSCEYPEPHGPAAGNFVQREANKSLAQVCNITCETDDAPVIAWCVASTSSDVGRPILLIYSLPGITTPCINEAEIVDTMPATSGPVHWSECLEPAPRLARIPDFSLRRSVAQLAALRLASVTLV